MSDQVDVDKKGGTMRLGIYPCKVEAGTKTHEAYGEDLIYERHRHRYEFNNEYRQQLTDAGLVIVAAAGAVAEIGTEIVVQLCTEILLSDQLVLQIEQPLLGLLLVTCVRIDVEILLKGGDSRDCLRLIKARFGCAHI